MGAGGLVVAVSICAVRGGSLISFSEPPCTTAEMGRENTVKWEEERGYYTPAESLSFDGSDFL